jgi:hypothetical protein
MSVAYLNGTVRTSEASIDFLNQSFDDEPIFLFDTIVSWFDGLEIGIDIGSRSDEFERITLTFMPQRLHRVAFLLSLRIGVASRWQCLGFRWVLMESSQAFRGGRGWCSAFLSGISF